MRIYRHWIKLSMAAADKDLHKGLKIIEDGAKRPGYHITIFRSETNLWDRFFLVETSDNYNDLEMDVNSFSSPLRRLTRKPTSQITRIDIPLADWIARRRESLAEVVLK